MTAIGCRVDFVPVHRFGQSVEPPGLGFHRLSRLIRQIDHIGFLQPDDGPRPPSPIYQAPYQLGSSDLTLGVNAFPFGIAVRFRKAVATLPDPQRCPGRYAVSRSTAAMGQPVVDMSVIGTSTFPTLFRI